MSEDATWKRFEERYVMVRKTRAYYFLGGCVGFLIGVFGFSWAGTKAAFLSEKSAQASAKILEMEIRSRESLIEISNLVKALQITRVQGRSDVNILHIGEYAVCWDTKEVKTGKRQDLSDQIEFSFKFPVQYIAQPTVVSSVNALETDGYAYAVFAQQVSRMSFAGEAREVRAKAVAGTKVIVSYIAIGKATQGGL